MTIVTEKDEICGLFKGDSMQLFRLFAVYYMCDTPAAERPEIELIFVRRDHV